MKPTRKKFTKFSKIFYSLNEKELLKTLEKLVCK